MVRAWARCLGVTRPVAVVPVRVDGAIGLRGDASGAGRFQEPKRSVVMPMILRHQEKFPTMRHRTPMLPSQSTTAQRNTPASGAMSLALATVGESARCVAGADSSKITLGRHVIDRGLIAVPSRSLTGPVLPAAHNRRRSVDRAPSGAPPGLISRRRSGWPRNCQRGRRPALPGGWSYGRPPRPVPPATEAVTACYKRRLARLANANTLTITFNPRRIYGDVSC